MAFTLPVLKTKIDCADLGYPGLAFTLRLNPTNDEPWKAPDKPEVWDRPYYAGLGRLLLWVEVPAEYGGDGSVTELGTARAVYELEQQPGFDQSILPWLVQRFQKVRAARLADELGN
jgi:hypothetical protein